MITNKSKQRLKKERRNRKKFLFSLIGRIIRRNIESYIYKWSKFRALFYPLLVAKENDNNYDNYNNYQQ